MSLLTLGNEIMNEDSPKNVKLIDCPNCGTPIAKTARTCPKCGQEKPKQKASFEWVVYLLLIAIVWDNHFNNHGFFAPLISSLIGENSVTDLPAQKDNLNEQDIKKTIVTLREYQEVSTGMSYQEVARIIGTEGVELFRTTSGSLETVIYQWSNEGMGSMSATFNNDKLDSKGQYGLQ